MCIEEQHPEVAAEFHKGNFVVHKSDRAFSAVAIDQAHEWLNAVIKGDGGAVGLTENPSALRRWMLAGPEVSRLVANYEALSGAKAVKKGNHHHEQIEAAQKAFFEKVKRLTSVMREMGNPFMSMLFLQAYQEEYGNFLQAQASCQWNKLQDDGT